jgi:SSS family solute:Na+ symporter
VASLVFTLWASLTEGGNTINMGGWNFPWHDYMIGAIGHLVLLVVGVSISYLAPGTPLAPELTLLSWRRSVIPGNRSAPVAALPLSHRSQLSQESSR